MTWDTHTQVMPAPKPQSKKGLGEHEPEARRHQQRIDQGLDHEHGLGLGLTEPRQIDQGLVLESGLDLVLAKPYPLMDTVRRMKQGRNPELP